MKIASHNFSEIAHLHRGFFLRKLRALNKLLVALNCKGSRFLFPVSSRQESATRVIPSLINLAVYVVQWQLGKQNEIKLIHLDLECHQQSCNGVL